MTRLKKIFLTATWMGLLVGVMPASAIAQRWHRRHVVVYSYQTRPYVYYRTQPYYYPYRTYYFPNSYYRSSYYSTYYPSGYYNSYYSSPSVYYPRHRRNFRLRILLR